MSKINMPSPLTRGRNGGRVQVLTYPAIKPQIMTESLPDTSGDFFIGSND